MWSLSSDCSISLTDIPRTEDSQTQFRFRSLSGGSQCTGLHWPVPPPARPGGSDGPPPPAGGEEGGWRDPQIIRVSASQPLAGVESAPLYDMTRSILRPAVCWSDCQTAPLLITITPEENFLLRSYQDQLGTPLPGNISQERHKHLQS